MVKSIKVAPKKRGRGRPPTGGRDPIIGVRFPPPMIAGLEAEAKKRGVKRSEIVRAFVAECLERIAKAKK